MWTWEIMVPMVAVVALPCLLAVLVWQRRPRPPPSTPAEVADAMLGGQVPAWASFFTPAQYATFELLVLGYFRDQQRPAIVQAQTVILLGGSYAGGTEFPLSALARSCASQPEATWPRLVQQHFADLATTHEVRATDTVPDWLSDFAHAQRSLAVHLIPQDTTLPPDEPLVWREDLRKLRTMLVQELPTGYRPVTRALADTWGVDDDELFALALANVWRRTRLRLSVQQLEGHAVSLFASEQATLASHAVMLRRHGDFIGTYGSLVAVPHPYRMLVYPIEDQAVLEVITRLLPAVRQLAGRSATPISRELYWFDGRRYHLLPCKEAAHSVHVMPPTAFMAMVAELPERRAEGE